MTGHIIEGHAIVSPEGAIADSHGGMPDCLRVDEDWRQFQRRLDLSVLVVLGRLSHEAVANRGRRRLVITSSADGLERLDRQTWRLDPARLALKAALDQLARDGGRIAVVGGTAVFDLFLSYGYDAFFLTIVGNCRIDAGIPVFTGIASAAAALARLAGHGLTVAATRVLDPRAGAVLHHLERR
jgi:dihydrofolate reductase